VSITRAIRALESLEKDFEFVACSSDCYSTAEIFFTPKLFEFLGVFPLSERSQTEVSGRQKAAGRVQMSNAHNPQHWSQLDMDEQIRFWQGVEDGHVASFLVSRRRNLPSPARRALHKTQM
jgi:hypothetical protein